MQFLRRLLPISQTGCLPDARPVRWRPFGARRRLARPDNDASPSPSASSSQPIGGGGGGGQRDCRRRLGLLRRLRLGCRLASRRRCGFSLGRPRARRESVRFARADALHARRMSDTRRPPRRPSSASATWRLRMGPPSDALSPAAAASTPGEPLRRRSQSQSPAAAAAAAAPSSVS